MDEDDQDGQCDIELTGPADVPPSWIETVRRAVVAALHAEGCRAATLSVALVSDPAIAELNLRHCGHDGPTDVLAFDLRESPRDALDGEVVVSVDRARHEADRRGLKPEAELALYAIHGVLHLLGYDDHDDGDARRMHGREEELLARLGHPGTFAAPPNRERPSRPSGVPRHENGQGG